MTYFQLSYKQFGERSILIEWSSKIDENVLEDVLFFEEKLKNSLLEEIIYIKSAYNSILVVYHITINNIYDKILTLKELYLDKECLNKPAFRQWKIPVCYDDKFGIDSDEISQKKNIPKQDIITLHSEVIYTVFFIGFLPGFLYLGWLNKTIHFPRKSTPRLCLEKGAVAIGGNQTGVYPCQSPGGWNVIGNSPINFFNINLDVPCFAKPGDKIKFCPINLKEHQDISTLVEAGVYQLESEVIHG